jgi:hypothetical protein
LENYQEGIRRPGFSICFIYNMEDLEEERGIQNFKSHLSALEREMKDFGSWIQTSLTQTKDHLGVGPKCQ